MGRALYNDVFSNEKEEAVGYLHNVVQVIRADRSCSTREAVDIVNRVLTGLVTQFQAACEALPAQLKATSAATPEITEAALDVLEGYRHLLRGNFDYHIDTARYVNAREYVPQAQTSGIRPSWSTADVLHPTAQTCGGHRPDQHSLKSRAGEWGD
ncbi:hypothetical protein ACE1OC_00090 [Streptomyces sp. DSM 116496]|uniref:terpene synthase family protein n=1 Tax=Streptomyces stoeckheimensis TaxID=3344656 RepID=UPI0038B30650